MRKIFLAWFSLSTTYMLGFPALMSATVGYLKPATVGCEKSHGNFLIHQSSDLKTCYNVTAGARNRYKNATLAPVPPVGELDVMKESPWLLPRLKELPYALLYATGRFLATPNSCARAHRKPRIRLSSGEGDGDNWRKATRPPGMKCTWFGSEAWCIRSE